MSSSRGIFENFNNQSSETGTGQAQRLSSPFAVAPEQWTAPQAGAKPSKDAQPEKPSPFAAVSENEPQADEAATRLPERCKPTENPFPMTEPQDFGFEAQPPAKASPLESAPASPFSIGQADTAVPKETQNPFGGWPQADATPAAPQPSSGQESSDSHSIKQLELRAIFGVDREMTVEEILQRSRSLPGIRQIAQASESDISAVDAMKQVISNLGFGSGAIKLYSDSAPIEFIREGRTLLAIQTDGSFAPGVREALILVARELGR